jgi:hypothetical protein
MCRRPPSIPPVLQRSADLRALFSAQEAMLEAERRRADNERRAVSSRTN